MPVPQHPLPVTGVAVAKRIIRSPVGLPSILTIALLAWMDPYVFVVLGSDLPCVLLVVAAAAGYGIWFATALAGRDRPDLQLWSIATALGIGVIGAATLGLGATGLLSSPSAWTLVLAGCAAGLLWIMRHRPGACSIPSRPATEQSPAFDIAERLLLLTLALPMAIMLFSACLPPGMIWLSEGRGYDVLEYHLQGPREYFEAGRIHFLSHNVYASFPQQVEMLYLLLMHLRGGPYTAAIPAQLLHATLGVLSVLALASFSAPGLARVIVASLAGAITWLAYGGALAYVENGMLLFAAVAGGLMLGEFHRPKPSWSALFAAGLCAGFAAGTKYTALVLVAGALALSWLVIAPMPLKRRILHSAVFGAGCLLAFGPWLARNAAFTGNPVYPFAYEIFGGRDWSTAQDQQWARGHRVKAEFDSTAGRGRLMASELAGAAIDGKWEEALNATLVLIPFAALGLRRARETAFLALWSLLILAAWLLLTHMPGRFLVPLLVPLTLLCRSDRGSPSSGSAILPPGRSSWRWWPAILVAAIAGGLNNLVLASAVQANQAFWSRFDVRMADLLGQTREMRGAQQLNSLPETARLWLIGDAAVFYLERPLHYTVVFNRDPWLEFAATQPGPAALIDWLRIQNVTHLVFSWGEIERLRATYGFPSLVTRAWVDALVTEGGLRRVRAPASAGPDSVEILEVPPR